MSRVKKTIINARVNLIFYSISLFLSFYSRKIFLTSLGAAFLGLTATISNILGFINLSELGIGTAITYLLFKPLERNDSEEINQIFSFLRYYYKKIGIYVLSIGVLASLFLPLFFEKSEFDLTVIYIVFYSYLFNLFTDYFFNYKQLLFVADQKNYYKTIYAGSINIVKIILQIICLIYFDEKIYYYLALDVGFNILRIIVLRIKVQQKYTWLNPSKIDKSDLNLPIAAELRKNTKQIFSHQFAGYILDQTDQILIYFFTSLSMVAYYANYTLLIGRAISFIDQLLNGSLASVGNLIASENSKKIKLVFDEFLALRYFLSGIIIFGCYNSVSPFIELWLGKEYLLNQEIFFLMLINWYIMMVRQPIDSFLYGYGIFHDTWASWTEALLNLIISVIAGYYFGIQGILAGTLISLFLIVVIWKPILLFKEGFNLGLISFWKTIITFILLLLISGFLTLKTGGYIVISLSINSYMRFGLNLLISTSIFSLIYFIFLYISSKGMRTLSKRIFFKLKPQ